MSADDSFFSRWSRRKTLERSGTPLPEPVPEPGGRTPPAAPAAAGTVGVPPTVPVPPAPALPGAGTEPPPPEPALPTLDDVAQLTPQSDFKPFVARAVDPQVRNAAMKTLFSDPHFNVMDGLDIYIDDYAKPDPLPLALARKLTSAQFMKVFDAPEEAPEQPTEQPTELPPPATSTATPPVPTPANPAPPRPIAQAAAEPQIPPEPPPEPTA